MGHKLWESASPHMGCLADSFQVLLIKINCPGRFRQRKHPKLQAEGYLKIDVLRAASETLIFAFLTPEL